MRSSLKTLLPLISILAVMFATPVPAQATQPVPQIFSLQTQHSLVTSNTQAGTLTVALSGAAGSIDVVHNLLSGTNEKMTVTLANTPSIMSFPGNGLTLATGVTLNANGAVLAWAGYNLRNLPCPNGLPTMKLTRESGYTFTVTNPSPDSMWVTFSYDQGMTFAPWVEVPAHSGKAFPHQRAAALAYVAHAAGLGPYLVCGNAGWNLQKLNDTAVARR